MLPLERKGAIALCPSITPLLFSAIGGYISVAYDGSCWLGCVLNVNEQEHAITVTYMYLHPSIPFASFFHLEKGCLDIDPSNILTRVQPSIATATGRTYALSKKEVENATNCSVCVIPCLHDDGTAQNSSAWQVIE